MFCDAHVHAMQGFPQLELKGNFCPLVHLLILLTPMFHYNSPLLFKFYSYKSTSPYWHYTSVSENKAVGVMKPGHTFTIEPMISEGSFIKIYVSDSFRLFLLVEFCTTYTVRFYFP